MGDIDEKVDKEKEEIINRTEIKRESSDRNCWPRIKAQTTCD